MSLPVVARHHCHVAAVGVAALSMTGCFQSSTILRVRADRTGTIEQRTAFTGAALTQFKLFAQLGGSNSQAPDLMSEQQARAMAAAIGPGVTYVSSTPIKTDTMDGRDSIYAFQDINMLKISQRPPTPGGVSVRADSLGMEPMHDITFHLESQPGGNAVLRIAMPDLRNMPGAPSTAAGNAAATQTPSAAQIAMLKQMTAGLRLTVGIEPDGQVVKTNSQFVDGNRVTLIDIDFDQFVGNDEVMRKLQGTRSAAEAQAIMKDIPGFRFTAEREVTIEFAPRRP